MGMKLLSVLATKDTQQQELTRKLLRTQEVEELAKNADARLVRAEADFSAVLAKNKEKWALEIEEHQKMMSDMEKEVKSLENRKEQALIPIYLYKKEADKLIEEAQEIVKRAKEKEEQADYLTEKLENKLSEVADRESIVYDQEKRLAVAKQGLQSQQEATREGVKRLSEEMIRFHEKQQAEEASLLKRKEEVSMAEISFNAKTEKYQRDLEALKIWEIQIKDREETVKRTFERLNK